MPEITEIDMKKIQVDEEYFETIRALIIDGKLKPTDKQKPWIRVANGIHWRKHIPPSQDPKDHQNDISRVCRVGVRGFFQQLSDMFIGM